MNRLLTNRTASITQMRQPHKVLEQAGGQPVAVMRNNQCVGYFIPAEVVDQVYVTPITRSELLQSMAKTHDTDAAVHEYLKDK